jgi:hypothetical protein
VDEENLELAMHDTSGQLRTLRLPLPSQEWKMNGALLGNATELPAPSYGAKDATIVSVLAPASSYLQFPRSDWPLARAVRAGDVDEFDRLFCTWEGSSSSLSDDLLAIAVTGSGHTNSVAAIVRRLLWGHAARGCEERQRAHCIQVETLDGVLRRLTFHGGDELGRVPFELALAEGHVAAACEIAVFAMVLRNLNLALRAEPRSAPVSAVSSSDELLLVRFTSRTADTALCILVAPRDATIRALGTLSADENTSALGGGEYKFGPVGKASGIAAQLSAWLERNHAVPQQFVLPLTPGPYLAEARRIYSAGGMPASAHRWKPNVITDEIQSLIDPFSIEEAGGVIIEAEDDLSLDDRGRLRVPLGGERFLEVLPNAVPFSMPVPAEEMPETTPAFPQGGLRGRGESDASLARLLRGTWAVYNSTAYENRGKMTFAYCMVLDSDAEGRIFGMDCPWSHSARSEDLPFFFRYVARA